MTATNSARTKTTTKTTTTKRTMTKTTATTKTTNPGKESVVKVLNCFQHLACIHNLVTARGRNKLAISYL